VIEVNQSSARLWIYTFKEGLLSPIAHDLKLELQRFSLAIDETAKSVRGRFEPRSIRVECAIKNGAESPSTLSSGDRATIERNIMNDVLAVSRYPLIEFESTRIEGAGDAWSVTGSLALHGQTRTLTAQLSKKAHKWSTQVRLHQPDFGIKPYSAFLGTLKVRSDVMVVLEIDERS